MKSTPLIFIISLPEQKRRRNHLSQQLNSMGLSYVMTDAVNGRQLNLDNLYPPLDMAEYKRLWGEDMSRPEIGCFLSHHGLWQHIVDNNLPYALIMEDDIVIDKDLPTIIEMSLSSKWQWDIIRLSAFKITDQLIKKGYTLDTIDRTNQKTVFNLVDKKVSPMGNRFLVRYKRNVIDTAAYIITQTAARTLINTCQTITEPVDHAYDVPWKTGLQLLGITPPVIRQTRQVKATNETEVSALEIYRKKRRQANKNSYKAIISIAWHKAKNRARQRLWNLRNPLKKN